MGGPRTVLFRGRLVDPRTHLGIPLPDAPDTEED